MTPLLRRDGGADAVDEARSGARPETGEGEPLGSWHAREYVSGWLAEDVVGDMLGLPRRLSAAIVADAGIDVAHVIDLGAGAGPYLAVLLDAFPAARGTWVDSSEPMLESARQELRGYGGRVRFALGDIRGAGGRTPPRTARGSTRARSGARRAR